MISTGTRIVGSLLARRQMYTNAEIIANCTEIRNRNPRNLERLRIARKPEGYHLEEPGLCYWHKLVINRKSRGVSAEIHHFENGPVIVTSSSEWGLKIQLYRTSDAAAYIGVGRVLAQRCLESGIYEVYYEPMGEMMGKLKLLIDELEKSGLILTEPEKYKNPHPWDMERPVKPWSVQD